MKHVIAFALSVLINVTMLGALGVEVHPNFAPAGSVQVTDLNGAEAAPIVVAAADHVS